MKTPVPLLVILGLGFASLTASLPAAPPVVSNGRAAQRPGTEKTLKV